MSNKMNNIKKALLIIITSFMAVSFSCKKVEQINKKYANIKVISYNENGQEYSLKAISGQVIVIFDSSISNTKAIKDIQQLNGKIISSIKKSRYYLVDTGLNKEKEFINNISKNTNIKYVYFNVVEYPCKPKPQTYVLDNFYISHGEDVSYVLKECGLTTRLNSYNVGIKGDDNNGLSWNEIDKDLISILNFHTNDTPAIINMSFGPAFTDKKSYIKHYKDSLKHLVKITSNYKNKDFVIVKSSGNENIKQLDTEILNDLLKEGTEEEIKILNEHFILAGAVDDIDPEYSNSVTMGKYNSLYTSVDISDLYDKIENFNGGTSFAAPRISCFISTLVNDSNIKATDVLTIIKNVTKNNPDKPIEQEEIEKEIKKTIEIKTNEEPLQNNNETQYIYFERKKDSTRKNNREDIKENKATKDKKNKEKIKNELEDIDTGDLVDMIHLSGGNTENPYKDIYFFRADIIETITLKDGNIITSNLFIDENGDLNLDIVNYAPYPIIINWKIDAPNFYPTSGQGEAAEYGEYGYNYKFLDFIIIGRPYNYYYGILQIIKDE
jgi:hypothetical protein